MSQKKALIVDDSTVTRLMIRKIILDKYPDWEILEASSADDAKSLLTDHQDIVFFHFGPKYARCSIRVGFGRRPQKELQKYKSGFDYS